MRSLHILLCVIVLLGCRGSDQAPALFIVASMDLDTRDAVKNAVHDAAAHPHSIVFVHVDWAFMEQQRELFEQFATDWNRARPEFRISFHYVDFTSASDDYSPLTNLPGWIETRERIGRQPFGGNGEWAWIMNGKLVDIGPVWPATTDELVARTESLFVKSNGE